MNDVESGTNPAGLPAKQPAKMEPAGQLTFEIDVKKHPLMKTLKKFDKNFDAALEVVLEVLADKTVDTKTRLQAAQYIVDTKLEISKEIGKEVLGRQIAQARLLMAQQPARKITDVEEDEGSPQAVFVPNAILKCDSQDV